MLRRQNADEADDDSQQKMIAVETVLYIPCGQDLRDGLSMSMSCFAAHA